MTQPNFLQVQTSLDRACVFVEAHPDLSSSERYGSRLRQMRDRFASSTTDTDRKYTEWRMLLGEEFKKYRDIKLEYDAVLALADEHGYDDAPRHPIVYTEEASLFALVRSTITWLKSKNDEWTWLGERRANLERLVGEAAQQKKASTAVYQQYTVLVKRRVTGYDDAVAIVREYLQDARREAQGFEAFAGLQLDVI